MARPTLEVAEIFRRYGDTYRAAAGSTLSTAQRRVMTAIESCRTATLGGHVEQCDACGHQRIAYSCCANRHCPKCQSLKRAAWICARTEDLLDVEYFHVVFMVPQDVAALAAHNKATVYNLLFRATAETLRTIAADPKHLGAELGGCRAPHVGANTGRSSSGTFSFRSVAGIVSQSGLTPERALPRHKLSFSNNVYSRFCSDGRKTPVITDFMARVVPMPRLCIAPSRSAR